MPNRHRHGRTVTTAPTAEPVTLTEVKTHLRITTSDDDTYLNDLIKTAREYTERYTSRAFISQTIDIWFDAFPASSMTPLELPAPPLISVTHIKYYDNDDVLQTWSSANYIVDTDGDPGIVYPARNQSWPSPRVFPRSVNVQYLAGYEDSGASPVDLADNVPMPIKQAILLLIGHLYENREATAPGIAINDVPLSYRTILAPYKLQAF